MQNIAAIPKWQCWREDVFSPFSSPTSAPLTVCWHKIPCVCNPESSWVMFNSHGHFELSTTALPMWHLRRICKMSFAEMATLWTCLQRAFRTKVENIGRTISLRLQICTGLSPASVYQTPVPWAQLWTWDEGSGSRVTVVRTLWSAAWHWHCHCARLWGNLRP